MTDKTDPQDEWTEVSEPEVDETKIVFDTIGDEFTGIYYGHRIVKNEDGEFPQFLFDVDGERYFTNGNYSLTNGMKSVRKGAKVKIRFSSEKDTGRASPLRIFQVFTAKAKAVTRK